VYKNNDQVYIISILYIYNMTPHQMTIEVNGYQVIEKIVKAAGNSGRIYVPNNWIGKRVKVVLLEPIESD